ncbi:MAG: type II secretion system protein [Thermodesulfobacteriota bacterium]|nr:type II secretion system protein [Thermodesulfobacteriota bacterium]
MMTPISIVGNRSSARLKPSQAYTLVELTVVIFMIGLMLAFTIPRIQHNLLSDDLKAATRRMIAVVRNLKDMAVRDQKVYRLHVDMESDCFWVEWDAITLEEQEEARENASRLPGEVRILDICRRQTGKKDMGDAVIHFTPRGYVEYAVIHLGRDEERAHTIVLSPFVGTIKTHDTYVEIENM